MAMEGQGTSAERDFLHRHISRAVRLAYRTILQERNLRFQKHPCQESSPDLAFSGPFRGSVSGC